MVQRSNFLFSILLILLLLHVGCSGCDQKKGKGKIKSAKPGQITIECLTTPNGIPQKIIVSRKNVKYFPEPRKGRVSLGELFYFNRYFIFDKKDEYYKIGKTPRGDSILGWVHRTDVVEWNTREAIRFNKASFIGRNQVLLWKNEADVGYASRADFWEYVDKEPKPTDTPFPFLERKGNRYKIALLWLGSGLGGVGGYEVARVADVSRIGENIRKLDVVFVMDTTGSMKPYIADAKEKVSGLIESLTRMPFRPELSIGLVAYRDVGDEYVTKPYPLTDSAAKIVRDVNEFVAAAGGDRPEAVLEALKKAMDASMRWQPYAQKLIFLVGDAPPHDTGDAAIDEVAKIAHENKISVYSLGVGGHTDMEAVFKKIAERANGRYAPIAEASSLIKDVEEILKSTTKEMETDFKVYENISKGHSIISVTDSPGLTENEVASSVERLRKRGIPVSAKGFDTAWLIDTGGENRRIQVFVFVIKMELDDEIEKLKVEANKLVYEGRGSILKLLPGILRLPGGKGTEAGAYTIGEMYERAKDLPERTTALKLRPEELEKIAELRNINRRIDTVLKFKLDPANWNDKDEAWIPLEILP